MWFAGKRDMASPMETQTLAIDDSLPLRYPGKALASRKQREYRQGKAFLLDGFAAFESPPDPGLSHRD